VFAAEASIRNTLLQSHLTISFEVMRTYNVDYVSCVLLINSVAAGKTYLAGRDKSANVSFVELRAQRGPCDCEDGICSCCTGYLMEAFSQKGINNFSTFQITYFWISHERLRTSPTF
jgi:hypothetical protein